MVQRAARVQVQQCTRRPPERSTSVRSPHRPLFSCARRGIRPWPWCGCSLPWRGLNGSTTSLRVALLHAVAKGCRGEGRDKHHAGARRHRQRAMHLSGGTRCIRESTPRNLSLAVEVGYAGVYSVVGESEIGVSTGPWHSRGGGARERAGVGSTGWRPVSARVRRRRTSSYPARA